MARTKKTTTILRELEDETKQLAAPESVGEDQCGDSISADKVVGVADTSNDEEILSEEKVEIVQTEGNEQKDETSAADVPSGASEGGNRSSKKRTVADMTEKLHYSSKLVRFHTNWKEFEGYLTSYQHDTSTVMVVSETLNVRLRNARIKDMKIHEGKALSELPLVPDTMDPYQRVYICTHGWKPRSRSTASDNANVDDNEKVSPKTES